MPHAAKVLKDSISHMGKIEPIDVIEDWSLGFHLGNAVKYIARVPHKGTQLEDLQKARWYLDRAIARLQVTMNPPPPPTSEAVRSHEHAFDPCPFPASRLR